MSRQTFSWGNRGVAEKWAHPPIWQALEFPKSCKRPHEKLIPPFPSPQSGHTIFSGQARAHPFPTKSPSPASPTAPFARQVPGPALHQRGVAAAGRGPAVPGAAQREERPRLCAAGECVFVCAVRNVPPKNAGRRRRRQKGACC